jgi:two-component system, OmpR family, response regulator VicR
MPKKILTVDNEQITVNLVKDILDKQGYKVTKAISGHDCLKELEAHPDYDLILLDIMMPDMSGWDVYERIRKKDKKIKVVFLSVIEVSNERLGHLRQDGLSGYITKPFTPEELIKVVKEVIGK